VQRILRRIPAGRFGTIEEVVDAGLYLCSSEADYITGETLTVDGGEWPNSDAFLPPSGRGTGDGKVTPSEVAVVTGASRNIGRAIAVALAARGAAVACTGRDEQALAETVDLIEGVGGTARAYVVDMSDDAAVQTLPGRVVEAYGRLDVVVNNAGVMQEAAAVDVAVSDFRRLLDVNLTSYFLLAQASHPYFAGSGVVLNIGSIFGSVGASHTVAYCTSKAGVDGLTRALAAEWARDGIRVLSLAPGYVESEISRGILEDEKLTATC